MKKLFAMFFVGVLISVQAWSVTITGHATNGFTLAGNTGNPIIQSNGLSILKITLTSTNPLAATFAFFDSENHKWTNAIGAYTNTSLITSNHIYKYTNIVGVVEEVTNSMIAFIQASVSAATYTNRQILNGTIGGTNATITASQLVIEPVYPLVCTRGLMMTNSQPLIYTIEYTPYR